MNESRKQYKVLARAFSFLQMHHREEHIAEILLQYYLEVDRAAFYTMMQEEVPKRVYEKFQTALHAHATTGIPVQHLTGYEEFFGRTFHVNKDVLIPRMETEELVALVMEQVKEKYSHTSVTIADVGTGSGIISTTLALELPQATVYATDISKAALTVAAENAERLQASVQFMQGNFVQPFIDKSIKIDVVVSNPPYISEQERVYLSDTVKNFDPALALFAREKGLAAYREILSQLKKSIAQPQMIFFEIGYKQKDDVIALSKYFFPKSYVQCIQDMNGHDRIIAIFLSIV